MQREVRSTVINVKPRMAVRYVSLDSPVFWVESILMRVLSIIVRPKHLLIDRLFTVVLKVGICLGCVRSFFVVLYGLKEHRHIPEIFDHAAIFWAMAHPLLVEVFHDGAMDDLGWKAEDDELWCANVGHPNCVAERRGFLRPKHMLNVQPISGYVARNHSSDSPGNHAVTGSHG